MGYQVFIEFEPNDKHDLKELNEFVKKEPLFIKDGYNFDGFCGENIYGIPETFELMVYGSNFDNDIEKVTKFIVNKLIDNGFYEFKIRHSR